MDEHHCLIQQPICVDCSLVLVQRCDPVRYVCVCYRLKIEKKKAALFAINTCRSSTLQWKKMAWMNDWLNQWMSRKQNKGFVTIVRVAMENTNNIHEISCVCAVCWLCVNAWWKECNIGVSPVWLWFVNICYDCRTERRREREKNAYLQKMTGFDEAIYT